MKGTAVMVMLGVLFVFVLGLGVRSIFLAIGTFFEDRTMRKDCAELSRMTEERNEEKRCHDVERLDNGCEHLWGAMIGAFPADACRLCGLEKECPPGECDHIWRIEMAGVPFGYCETCNLRYVKTNLAQPWS